MLRICSIQPVASNFCTSEDTRTVDSKSSSSKVSMSTSLMPLPGSSRTNLSRATLRSSRAWALARSRCVFRFAKSMQSGGREIGHHGSFADTVIGLLQDLHHGSGKGLLPGITLQLMLPPDVVVLLQLMTSFLSPFFITVWNVRVVHVVQFCCQSPTS